MARGIELATAYVTLAVEASSIPRQIGTAFAGGDRIAADAGKKMGQALTRGIDSEKPKLDGLRAEVEKAKRNVDQAGKDMAAAMHRQEQATQLVTQRQKELTAATEKYGQGSSQVIAKERQLADAKFKLGVENQKVAASQTAQAQAQEKATGTAKTLADAQTKAAEAQKKAGNEAQGADKKFGGLGKAMAGVDVNGFKSAMSNIDWNGISRGVGAVALGVAGAFGGAAKTAADFEQRMSAVKAVSGATAPELQQLHDKALQLGKDTAFSASESATAIEELVKAGVTVPQVMAGAADATVALAAASGVSMPEAATIASNAMNSFGIEAGKMGRVADLIAGAANASAIDVGEFGQSLQQSGAIAKLAGMPFDDLAVAIAEMGNAGIKGSDAGTSLKTMLNNLQPTSKAAYGTMQRLGIITADGANRFYDAQGKLKSLSEVQQILQSSTAGLTEQQRQQALETMFGSDAIRAAAVMAQNGSAGFNELAGAMGKVTAAQTAADRMGNLKGQVEQMKGSVETLAITLGEKLIPPINTGVKAVTDFVDGFLKMPAGQQQLWLGIAAGVGAVAAGLFTAIKVAQGAVAIYRTGEAIKEAVTAFKKLRGAILAAEGAQRLLNIAQRASVIGLIVTAIALLVAGLIYAYNHSEKFRNIVNAIGSVIMGAFRAAVDWITNTAWPAIKNFFGGIGGAASDGISKVRTFFQPLVDWIQGFVLPRLQELGRIWAVTFQSMWQFVKPVVDFVVNVFMFQLRALGALFSWLWTNAIKPAVDAIVAGFQAFWGFVQPILASVGRLIWDHLVNTFNTLWAVAQVVWGGIQQVVSIAVGIIRNVVELFLNLLTGHWDLAWQNVKNITQGVFDLINAYIQTAVNAALAILRGMWNGIVIGFTWLRDTAVAVVMGMVNLIVNTITWLRNTAMFIVRSMVDGIVASFNWWRDMIVSIARMASQWVMDRLNWLKDLATATIRAMVDFIVDRFNWWRDTIVGIAETAKNWIIDRFNNLKETGTAVFQSMVEGIGRIWDGLKAAASAPVRFVIDTVINNGIIKGWNDLVGLLKLEDKLRVAPISVPGFAAGGRPDIVPGSRARGTDSTLAVTSAGVPIARVDPGEGIVRFASMQRLDRNHPGAFEHINRTGTLPMFADGGRVHPVPGFPVNWGRGYHGSDRGLDIPAPTGTPVVAMRDATVISTPRWGHSYGNHVRLSDGSIYAHLSQILVAVGQAIAAGSRLGLVGSTGNSTGPHLHVVGYDGAAPVGAAQSGGGFDPLAAITGFVTDKLSEPVKALLAKIPGAGMFVEAAKGLGSRMLDGAIEKIRSFMPTSGDPAMSGVGADSAGSIMGPLIDMLKARGMPRKVALIAGITAMQEASGRLDFTPDENSDVGPFQQRTPRDGTIQQLNDLGYALDVFLYGVRAKPGNGDGGGYHVPGLFNKNWQAMSPGQAAQAVQVSAYPTYYDKHIPAVNRMLDARGYWTGTRNAAPGYAWVGERGPELVGMNGPQLLRFRGGETVLNNKKTKEVMGTSGGNNYYFQPQVKESDNVDRQFEQFMWDVSHA